MPESAVSMRELLDAGVHFGHQTRRWHPKMKPFLYGERNGVHIIDLQQTLPRFRGALEFAKETVAQGGKLLFISTKRQAQDIVAETAATCGMPYVHRRWLGGMLTNFRTIKKGIERYKELNELLADEERQAGMSKKALSRLSREQLKLHKAFEGIAEMPNLPDAVFIVDIRREAIAIDECRRLQIPIIAVVDSNCDPDGIEFPVPGNDDALRAIRLYCEKLAEACNAGAEVFNARAMAQEKEAPPEAAAESEEAPQRGKRVVEITQPARRSARMERMAQEQKRELQAQTAATTPETSPAAEGPKVAEAAPEKPAADAAPEKPAARAAPETPAAEAAADAPAQEAAPESPSAE